MQRSLRNAVATTGHRPATRCIAFQSGRLAMGYSFSLGLSFLIGASILKTTIAPTWNDIAQLAAIIALRTTINFLLLRAIDTGTSQSE